MPPEELQNDSPNEFVIHRKVINLIKNLFCFRFYKYFKKPSYEEIFREKNESDIRNYEFIQLKVNNNKLDVQFQYLPEFCGAPNRFMYDKLSNKKVFLRKKAFTLRPNEVGKIIVNGRFSAHDTGEWFYEKNIVNIVYTNSPVKTIFTKTAVSKEYSNLAEIR